MIGRKKVSGHTYRINEQILLSLREKSIDPLIVWEIFNRKSYSRPWYELNENDTAVDIGAHIGVFTLYAAANVPKGKVFAYEPIYGNFSLLKKNVKQNRLTNVKIFNKAVTSNGRKIKIYVSPSNSGGHSIYPVDHNKIAEVESVTLENLMKQNRISKINFLKLDVEGAEFDIILKTPKNVFKKIDKIVMEYHDFTAKENNHKEIVSFLAECGFKTTVSGTFLESKIFRAGMILAKRNWSLNQSLMW